MKEEEAVGLAATSSTLGFIRDALEYWQYCIELELDGFEFISFSPSEWLKENGRL